MCIHKRTSLEGHWWSLSWKLGSLLLVVGMSFSLLPRAGAMGKASQFQVGHLALPNLPNKRPSGVRRLLWETNKRTSLKPHLPLVSLKPTDPKLFQYPLLYLPGDTGFAKLSANEIARLRSYLTAGGTLFIDMTDGAPGSAFDRSVRRMAKRLFPQHPLQRLPSKHTLFKSFYLARRFGGRVLNRPYVEGVTRDDRSSIIYSMNDLSGAWERDNFGNWTYTVVPGGASQREHAFRLGINIIMYALCINYKADLVHTKIIMRRRK